MLAHASERATWLPLAVESAAELGVVGAQVAVLHGDQVDQVNVGHDSLLTRSPVVEDTLFQIGSTTKVFTAVLALQLAEQGLLDLDLPVSEQLPSFRLPDPRATASLTVRQLMNMTSGIDNGPYVDHGRGDDALARYVEGLATLPLQGLPGQVFGYSNASTIVTGRLVEHVTGSTWEDALRERVLEPAGLGRTATLPEHVIGRRHAVGHEVGSQGLAPLSGWPLPRSMGPAGGLWATAGELVQLARVIMNDGQSPNGQRLLGSTGLRELHQPSVAVPPTLLADFWACGPYGKYWGEVALIGHSGTSAFGSSYLLWAPGHDVAVATVVNTPAAGYAFADRVFREVFPALLGITPPPRPEVLTGVVPDPDRYVGRYEMSGAAIEVTEYEGGLVAQGDGHFGAAAHTTLRRLASGGFLPERGTIDGGRGWGTAFLGPEDAPATHLLNGFFTMRRTA